MFALYIYIASTIYFPRFRMKLSNLSVCLYPLCEKTLKTSLHIFQTRGHEWKHVFRTFVSAVRSNVNLIHCLIKHCIPIKLWCKKNAYCLHNKHLSIMEWNVAPNTFEKYEPKIWKETKQENEIVRQDVKAEITFFCDRTTWKCFFFDLW